ncbi:MAG TPA: adenylate/guanylate cyclase domain-containing protein [Candidatus Limnocylindrales bacterium]|nr:adenylate/guanylate cyclase domain-containing protein [Candidatus Limnocylindrales bacterium]
MPSSERKIATMLFADLVGSTALAADEDPEQTRVVLERFYDAVSEEIEATGGTVEKFAGDAVLAVFGVPAAHEDHAERALHTALAIRARVQRLFGDRLRLRIGVATGEVVAGAPRAGSSFVAGDAVNVAARLEQAAMPGEILVGDRTAALVGAAFALSDPRTIEAKGKEGGISARRLLDALALARPRSVLGETFVGRGPELGALRDAYGRVVNRRAPAVVTVLGEPGVGKSRLLAEFASWLGRQEPAPLQRTGRCLSYGRGLTYRPMGDVLRDDLGLLESDPPAQALERLGERAILGLSMGLDVAGDLHPLVVRERLAQAWVALLDERTAEAPVVLLVEDVHWAEEPLIELLRAIRSRVRGPLLLITTARPEATDGLASDTRLELDPLTTGVAEEMVTALLGKGLPAPVRDIVVTRAEGNPLFIEELLATLIDRGKLRRSEGTWTAEQGIEARDLPDTVQSVLAARIDLLPAPEKRALQAASVVGRVFWVAPVLAVLGAEADLAVLERRGFVQRAVESSIVGDMEYSFKHQLTREVAYASLTRAERGLLHAAVAGYLEPDADDARAPILAHHYEQSVRDDYASLAWADDPDELDRLRARALHWLRLAARRAAARYEMDAAAAMYERAIELAPDDPTRFELWRALSEVHSLRYDTRGFVRASEQAIELAPDAGTVTSLFGELALRSCTAWLAWNPPLPRSRVEDWIERALAGSGPHSRERAMALVARAWHADRAEDVAAEALAIADQIGDPELIAWALRVRVIAAMQAGDYAQAAAGSERILGLLQRIDDPGHRETLIENTALRVAAATGHFEEARQYSQLVSSWVQDLTPHNRLHGAAYALEIEELTGDWERVRALEPRVERAVDDNLDTPCVRNARSLLVCALAETALGHDEAAARLAQRAAALGIEGYDRELAAPRLRMALQRGDLPEATRLLDGYGRPVLRFMFDMAGATAWLDASAALGRWDDIEREAPALAVPGTCLEPFALRALGIARDDGPLLERAARAFARLGLDWFVGAGRVRAAGRTRGRTSSGSSP